MQSKVSKGKGHSERSPRKPVTSFQHPLLVESHRLCLIPTGTSCDMCKILPAGKFIKDSVPGFFLGTYYVGILCTPCTKRFRFSKGKQVVSINYIVCANSLGRVSHSCQSWEWWEPSRNSSSQIPAKDQPCKKAFQRTLTLVHMWGCGWKVKVAADIPALGEGVCHCSCRGWCYGNFTPSDQRGTRPK